jgi:integrase
VAWITKLEGPRRGTRYRVEYRDPLGRHRTRTFRRRRDAEEFLHRVELDLQGGTWRDPRAAKVALRDRAEAWLAGRHDLRPATRKLYEGILHRHIIPALGDRTIGSIRPEDVRRFVSALLEAGVGARTAAMARQVLGTVLEEAVTDGVLPSNPVRGAPAPKAPRRELRVITPEELERLLQAMPPRWRPLVELAAWSGLRWGEVAGLQVGDLDLLAGRVHVRRQAVEVSGAPTVAELKTQAARRVVAIPRFVAESLAQVIPAGADPRSFVFPSAGGGPLPRRTWMARVWRPALRAAGLEGVRFHDLRHYAAAVAVAAGAHPRALQARLGHTTSRVTLDIYASVLPGLDEELAERLERIRDQARARATEGGRVVPLNRP